MKNNNIINFISELASWAIYNCTNDAQKQLIPMKMTDWIDEIAISLIEESISGNCI